MAMTGISRRRTVATFGSVMAGTALLPRLRLEALGLPIDGGQPEDEAFWGAVRSAFDVPEGICLFVGPHSRRGAQC
jgi:hypothetical protein